MITKQQQTMKKVLFTMVIAAGLYACGGGEETTETKPISNATTEEAAAPVKEESTTKAEEPPKEETKAVAKKDGKALIAGSDCRTCHKDDQKLIGPAYQDVAKKYEKNAKNVKMLAEKILQGGQGNWGEIPMAGHPNLSVDDASAMVEYILSMKK
jgi:cytochrome c